MLIASVFHMIERCYVTVNLAYSTMDFPFIVPMGSCGFGN